MRAWLLWLLILALPVYGATGTHLRLLGPAHSHAVPAQVHGTSPDRAAAEVTPTWLVRWVGQVQQLRAEAHLRAHALGRGASHHSHLGLEHHWHDAGDRTVQQAADPAVAELVAGAEAGSAMLVLAAPPRGGLSAQSVANGHWPSAPASRWWDAPQRSTAPPPRH